MSRTVEPRTDQYQRHVYVDDLPPCPIVPDAGEPFTAIGVTSQLKPLKADFSDHAAATVATWAVEQRAVWANLTAPAAIELIKGERRRALDKAANRGIDLHRAVEAFAVGQQTLTILDPAAAPYLPSVQRFVDECRPRFIWSEVAVFNREQNYAGKSDGVVTLEAFPELGVRQCDWKGLALDTPIPTPSGWATMWSLSVGDEVFGADGRPCRVVGKSGVHWRDCYRITFDDGSSVVCDDVHLWAVESGRRERVPALLTAAQLQSSLHDKHGHRHHRISNAAPLELLEVDLPVDPYVLGAWLGDGTARDGSITKPDERLWTEIAACGETFRESGQTRTIYGLGARLRTLGVLNNKHVPDIYLRSSRTQRLALLQGLMDTDGTWNKPRSQAVFETTDKGLALAVSELVVSLGWRANWWEGTARGFGLTVWRYRVSFTPFDQCPFRSRADDVSVNATTIARRRLVTNVERMPTVPTQCIAVDSVDSLFLCGEAMIPTHNSRTVARVYETEAPQLAAYAKAEYGILDGARVPLPAVDGGIVVCFTPDGYELFPVDLEQAWPVFLASKHLYQIKGDARRAVGKPIARRTEPMAPCSSEAVDHARLRVQSIVDAGLGAMLAGLWPADLPTLKQGGHDELQLSLVHDLCDRVQREGQMPFDRMISREPEPAPTGAEAASNVSAVHDDAASPAPGISNVTQMPADKDRIERIIERCKALPSDLFAVVEANTVNHGCPNLRTGRATTADAALVEAQLDLAEAEHQRRMLAFASLVQECDDDLVVALLSAAADGKDARVLTEADMLRVEELVAAVDACVLALDFAVEPVGLTTTPLAEEILITACGGKANVLHAGRQLASAHGFDAPRSAAAVAAQPLLAACVLSQSTNQPIKQATNQKGTAA